MFICGDAHVPEGGHIDHLIRFSSGFFGGRKMNSIRPGTSLTWPRVSDRAPGISETRVTTETPASTDKEEGRRKKEEGRRKKEEGRRKKEEGRRKKEEGGTSWPVSFGRAPVMGRHHRDYSQSSYSQWNHPHRARPEWGIGAATPLLAIALASCHDEIKPEISGTPENDIAPAQDDDDQGGGILYLTGWLMLLASLGQNSSSGASSTPVTPDPTPPDPVIAELRPPVFSAASYDFALDENIDGTEEAALIDHVSATSPDGHPVRYFLEDDNGNQVAATGGYAINPDTGAISYIGSGLDAEGGVASSSLKVVARVVADDGREISGTADVVISVTDLDEAPTAMSLSVSTASVPEGVTSARKLADITFTDDALGTNSATVDDTSLFEIRNGDELWLKAGVTLDFETDTSHAVTVTATTNTALSETFTLSVTDANDFPPEITSGATAAARPENAVVGSFTTLYTATGTFDVTPIVWSLSGADDDSLFKIDSSTGEVTFKTVTTPDYETKDSYSFTVKATSGSLEDQQKVTLAVTDVNEAPTLTADSVIMVKVENSGKSIADMTIYDDDEQGAPSGVVLTLDGADAGFFSIERTGNSANFELVWKDGATPDADDPRDANGDNIFNVKVVATIGTTILEHPFSITVTGTNEAPEITVTDFEEIVSDTSERGVIFYYGDEDKDTVMFTLSATDPDGDSLTWSQDSAFADNALFDFDEQQNGDLQISWKENPTSETASSQYGGAGTSLFVLQVEVADGGAGSLTDDVLLTVSLLESASG